MNDSVPKTVEAMRSDYREDAVTARAFDAAVDNYFEPNRRRHTSVERFNDHQMSVYHSVQEKLKIIFPENMRDVA